MSKKFDCIQCYQQQQLFLCSAGTGVYEAFCDQPVFKLMYHPPHVDGWAHSTMKWPNVYLDNMVSKLVCEVRSKTWDAAHWFVWNQVCIVSQIKLMEDAELRVKYRQGDPHIRLPQFLLKNYYEGKIDYGFGGNVYVSHSSMGLEEPMDEVD